MVAHAGYLLTLTTSILVNVPAGPDGAGGVGLLEPTLNPMVYAYSLPLSVGLVDGDAAVGAASVVQMLIAFAVIWIAQAFGIVAESLKFVAFDAGAPGAAAIARAGIGAERDRAGLSVRVPDPAGGRCPRRCGSG